MPVFMDEMKKRVSRRLPPLLDDNTLDSFNESLRGMAIGESSAPSGHTFQVDAEQKPPLLVTGEAASSPVEDDIGLQTPMSAAADRVHWEDLPSDPLTRVSEFLPSRSVLALAAACAATLGVLHEECARAARRSIVLARAAGLLTTLSTYSDDWRRSFTRAVAPSQSYWEYAQAGRLVFDRHTVCSLAKLKHAAVHANAMLERMLGQDARSALGPDQDFSSSAAACAERGGGQPLTDAEMEAAFRAHDPPRLWHAAEVTCAEFIRLAPRCVAAARYRRSADGMPFFPAHAWDSAEALRRVVMVRAGLRAAEVDAAIGALTRGYAAEAQVRGYTQGGGESGEVELDRHDFLQILFTCALDSAPPYVPLLG